MKVPKWLKLHEQIDLHYFLLTELQKKISNRSGMDIMIDQATGYDKELEKEATELMDKIDKMKAEYAALTTPPEVQEMKK